MRSIEYGQDLRGEFFRLIHNICETEIGVSMERTKTVQWYANPEIFAGYLALNPATLKLTPSRGNFSVVDFTVEFDNGDTSLGMDRSANNLSVDGDPFVEGYLRQAEEIFKSHDHGLCIENYEVSQASKEHGSPLASIKSPTGEVLIP